MATSFKSLTVHNKTGHQVSIETGYLGFLSPNHGGAGVHLYPNEGFPTILEPNGIFQFTYDHLARGRWGGNLAPEAYFGNQANLVEQLQVGKPFWVTLALPYPRGPIYIHSEYKELEGPRLAYDLVLREGYQLIPSE